MEKAGPQEEKVSKITKKVLWVVLTILVVAGAITFYLLTRDKPKDNYPVTNAKDACGFFTIGDAKSLIGKTAEKNGVSPSAQKSSENIEVVDCTYSQKPSTASNPAEKLKSSSVLIRSPKNSIGQEYNKYGFNEGRPAGMQDVSGYGQKAYWDPKLGLLNVLENNKWVILSNGVTSAPTERNLDDTKKLADIVVHRL